MVRHGWNGFPKYQGAGESSDRGGRCVGFQFWIRRFLEQGAYPFMASVLRNFRVAARNGDRVYRGVR
jgi:hypothetical protein